MVDTSHADTIFGHARQLIAWTLSTHMLQSAFIAFVSSLESPTERENRGEKVSPLYRFCFKFLNYLAFNTKRAKVSGDSSNADSTGGGKDDGVSDKGA